jgi:dihydroxyacetone kinase-like predicted kinase
MTTEVESHSGEELREMFAAATSWLERNADAINSINVFPVPDGDTGTNMYLTMRATLEEAYLSESDAADEVAKAMARGALMGARGNSGVILSQIFRGMADGLAGKKRFNGHDFVRALQEASKTAYKAVSQPVEGTILTVMREVAAAGMSGARSLGTVLASAATPWRRRQASCRCSARRAWSTPAARASTSCSKGRCATCAAIRRPP